MKKEFSQEFRQGRKWYSSNGASRDAVFFVLIQFVTFTFFSLFPFFKAIPTPPPSHQIHWFQRDFKWLRKKDENEWGGEREEGRVETQISFFSNKCFEIRSCYTHVTHSIQHIERVLMISEIWLNLGNSRDNATKLKV